MTSRDFVQRLERRARRADVMLPSTAVARLEAYYRLLMRWNTKMNLTALALAGAPDRALDRLIIEPLAAARYVPDMAIRWFDLGSGGGSPAIPLRIVRPSAQLTMVEAKTRKAAFLRDAIRVLELGNATVENVRFEEFGSKPSLQSSAQLVSVRAVRVDQAVVDIGRFLLTDGGWLHLYQTDAVAPPERVGFRAPKVHRLAETLATWLVVLEAAS